MLAAVRALPFARWRGLAGIAEVRGGGRCAGSPARGFFLLALSLWLGPMLLAAHLHDGPEYRAYVHDILFTRPRALHRTRDHHQPPWYYLGVIAFSWMPLSLALPWLVPAWRERLAARDARLLLPLAWIVLVVHFSPFPKASATSTSCPRCPGWPCCAAPWLADLARRAGPRRIALGLLTVLGSAALGTGPWLSRPAEIRRPRWRPARLRGRWCGAVESAARPGAVLLAAAGGAPVPRRAGPARRARRHVAAVEPVGLSGAERFQFGRRRDAPGRRIIGPDAQLALVARKEQNSLHADRPAVDFGFQQHWPQQLAAAAAWLRQSPRRWLFILGDAMGDCVDRGRATYVGHANRRESGG